MRRSPKEAAVKVVKELRKAGHETYLAGGAVRDHLLGIEPEDFDVATAARPEEVEALFRRTVAVGRSFGVVQVLVHGWAVEVATFRAEADYRDSRHPRQVTFTDARTDVERRDFTINGLLWDPLEDRIVDHVGGRADLEARQVRAIGDPDARFEEDALRLLRAVRFGSLDNFELEQETRRAVERNGDRLTAVAPERIREELAKMASGPRYRRGDSWRLLVQTGLASRMLLQAASTALQTRATSPGVAGRELFRLASGHLEEDARVLDALRQPRLESYLAVALRHLLPAGVFPASWRRLGEEVATALRCSREQTRLLSDLLACRPRYRSLPRAGPVRRRLAAACPEAAVHEDLLQAEGEDGVLELLHEERRLHGPGLPPPLLDGRDILRAGVPRGPRVGLVLRRLRVLQLAGRLEDREQALELARRSV